MLRVNDGASLLLLDYQCIFEYNIVELFISKVYTMIIKFWIMNEQMLMYQNANSHYSPWITKQIYNLQMIRNKRRMAKVQSNRPGSRVVNNATRAMIAVFVSNLIFGLPHSIYHLIPHPPPSYDIIFHVLFSTHFVIDPLVFIYFNHSYRRRISERLFAIRAWIATKCCGRTLVATPTFNSSTTTSSSHKETSHKLEEAL